MSRIKFTKRKECTVLTWPARLLLLLFIALFFGFLFVKTPSFLAKNEPVEQAEYLILDGQMPDYAIKTAINIFSDSNYKTIIATGGMLPSGYYVSGQKTMAELTGDTFYALGFDSTKLVVIPGGEVLKDRTYSSALTLKKYFEKNRIVSGKVNILAVSCHSRRSRILFQMALGNNFEVGVISLEDNSYDINNWWKTSKGVRTVISETVAYFYAEFIFNPENI